MPIDLHTLPDFPALQQLARALWHNGSIRGAALMIGAGFSKNADRLAPDVREPPNWGELVDELVEHLYREDPKRAPNEPLRIAEEYRTYHGQAALDGFIRTRFPDRSWLPGALHLQALNFPWSDILTTNWDTLIERTADEVTDYTYDVVRLENDIAQARSPRIIKLHGTLGDKDPLIFATEDYRTYPAKHAAFVNLARQIFIENDLCLLGFSGTDPNFLEWAGWVRDHLGDGARRIFLVGNLQLLAPARRFLEKLNIAPIDLAPSVEHLPSSERHRAATKLFLDALQAEKPSEAHEWVLHDHTDFDFDFDGVGFSDRLRREVDFAAEILLKTAVLFREDRERYPNWLVCPRRYRHLYIPYPWAFFRPEVLSRLTVAKRSEVLSEFLWRYTTSLQDFQPIFRDALVAVMEETNPPAPPEKRIEFAIALMRDARMEDNDPEFQRWSSIAQKEASPNDLSWIEANYQRCLRLRDKLDLDALAKALADFTGDAPLWRMRRAALHVEVGEEAKAHRLIKEASAELEKTYRLNRNSLWVKSCLAWSSLLVRAVAIGDFGRPAEWPRVREFRALKIDPHGDIDALENAALKPLREHLEEDGDLTPTFDIGTYRPGSKNAASERRGQATPLFYEMERLTEIAGLPIRLNNVKLAAGAASTIARLTCVPSARWYRWFVRILHSTSDQSFNRHFGRIALAQLPQPVAESLLATFEANVAFWRKRFLQTRSDDSAKDRSSVQEAYRLALYVLAHMTVRMTVEQARRTVLLACSLAKDPIHSWVLVGAAQLVKYALESLPASEKAALVLDVMQFPLAGERQGRMPGWPDLTAGLTKLKASRDARDHRWGQRIAELLDAASAKDDRRGDATARLAFLYRQGLLNELEIATFGNTLWAYVDSGVPPLPARTDLLDSAFATLPAPSGIDSFANVTARIVDADITTAMNHGDARDTSLLHAKRLRLISLYNIGPSKLMIDPKRAAELFDLIVAWRPGPSKDDFFGFTRGFDNFVQEETGEILAHTVVPAMAQADRTQERLEALLRRVTELRSWRSVAALPEFLSSVVTSARIIADTIRRSLGAADNAKIMGACVALRKWSTGAYKNELPPVPRRLVDQMLFMIELRPDDGLHTLLFTAESLLDDGILSDEDVTRVIHTLKDLREDTKYVDVPLVSRRAVTVPLIRQQCVRLARKLQGKVLHNATLDGWIEDGMSDPLPEVRIGGFAENYAAY